jgi:hypothetical protein
MHGLAFESYGVWLGYLGAPQLSEPDPWLVGPTHLPPVHDYAGRYLAFVTFLFERAEALPRLYGLPGAAEILAAHLSSQYLDVLAGPETSCARWRAIAGQFYAFRDVFARWPEAAGPADLPGDPEALSLGDVCLVWWDSLPIVLLKSDAIEMIDVLQRILGIEHRLCQQSALRGLALHAGQWPGLGAEEAIRTFAAGNAALAVEALGSAAVLDTGTSAAWQWP